MAIYSPRRDDIERLSAHQLEEVLHRSVKQIFFNKNIPLEFIDRRPYEYTKDGGIEIAFSIPKKYPNLAPFFKSRDVIIQSKATNKKLNVKQFLEEVLKSNVIDFLHSTDCSQYIIAYSKLHISSGKSSVSFKNYQKSLEEALFKIYPKLKKKVKIEIWLSDNIEPLVSSAPSTWEIFPQKELLSLKSHTLSSIEERDMRNKHFGFKTKFVANEARQEKIDSIAKKIVENNDSVIEIRGGMGIGKTRLCYEIIKELNLEDVCLWIEAPNPTILSEINSYLYSNKENSILLFNDELQGSDLIEIQRLKRAYPSQFRAIVVLPDRSAEPSQNNNHTFNLGLMPDDELTQIINSYKFNPELKKRICNICKGYPKLAVAISERLTETKQHERISQETAISLLGGDFYDPSSESTGWFRLIMSDEDRKRLGAMSIFMELGHKGQSVQEMEKISTFFDIRQNELRETINRGIKKGLIVDIGDYFYITPLLLANHLASMTFKNYQDSFLKIVEVASSMQSREGRRNRTALESLKNRILSCSEDEEIKSITKEVVKGFDENFLLAAFQDQGLIEFMLGLGHIYPDQVLTLILKTLQNLPDGDVFKIEKRRNLIHFLEKASSNDNTFKVAMDSLFILALNESETWANNATGVFINSFYSIDTNSMPSLRMRINYLKSLCEENINKNTAAKKIILKSLEKTFEIRALRRIRPESSFHNSDLKVETVENLSYENIKEIQLELFDFFKNQKNQELKLMFLRIASQKFRLLTIRFDVFEKDMIQTLLSSNDRSVLRNLYSTISISLRFDKENLTEATIEKLEKTQKEIIEQDFSTKLNILLSSFHGLDEHDKKEEKLFEVANEIIKTPSLISELQQLKPDINETQISTLIYKLGSIDEELELWPSIKEIIKHEDYEFLGYLTAYSYNFSPKIGFQLALEVENEFKIDPTIMIKTYSNLKGQEAKEKTLEMLTFLKEQGISSVLYTEFNRTLDSRDYTFLIKLFSDDAHLLLSLFSSYENKIDYSQIDLTNVITSLWKLESNGMDVWFLKEKFLPKTLRMSEYKQSFLTLFSKGLNVVSDSKAHFSHSQYCSELAEAIGNKYKAETFEIFKHFYDNSSNYNLASIHFNGWPYHIYIEYFIEIFKYEPYRTCEIFYRFLPNEVGVFTESSAIMIRRFENNSELESSLFSKIHTTYDVVSGPFSQHYESLLIRLKQWSSTYNLEKNRLVLKIRESLENSLIEESKIEKQEDYFNN